MGNFPDSPTVVTFFKDFPRNFSRIISCNWFLGNSREIFQNWSPRWEIFVGSQFWDSVSRISWEILWNFSPRNFSEFLQNNSPEIPEKFLGLSHHVYGFLGEFIKRISFEKFLRNSPDFFSGNSWEILRTWLPCLRIFRGILLKELVSRLRFFTLRNSWEILLNSFQIFLRNSEDLVTKFTDF